MDFSPGQTAVSLPGLRRIVTAHGASGKAEVQSDKTLLPETSLEDVRFRSCELWKTEGWPVKDNVVNEDGATRKLVDGGNFGLVHANGANVRSTDLAPGALTPMHRTSSIDFNVLVKGRLVLILDDGSETEITEAGSTVVQRGTIHAWRNPSMTEWARWVSVLLPAEPAVVDGKALPPNWF